MGGLQITVKDNKGKVKEDCKISYDKVKAEAEVEKCKTKHKKS